MRIHVKGIKPGEYAEMVRTDSGWDVFKDNQLAGAIPNSPQFNPLQLPKYRLLGLENEEARVIRFASLHCHSDNSLLDGMTQVPEMIKRMEYAGALTDHGNMYGFLGYYKGMKKAGKKPILGFEGYMVDLEGKLTRKPRHVILLAKNNQGVDNLFKLTSEAFDHFKSKPQITWEMLEKYHEGVICLTACLGGLVPTLIKEGRLDAAREAVQRFISIFGTDDFYIELQRHQISQEELVNKHLLQIAEDFGLKIVATIDSHYPTKEDSHPHEILLCIQNKKDLNDPTHRKYEGTGYWMMDSEEMEELFSDLPEALDNTLEIADKCNVELKLGEVNLPRYTIPEQFETPMDYMEHLAQSGYDRHFSGTPHKKDPVYLDRFRYELDMIRQMGFASYFIIVWDFINYCRTNNIYVGPGRGSAAGSLVAYCLGITDMDPIKYQLLFERFLNPERISWPDIDTDIEYSRRPEVIQYITQKYGAGNVCRIVTFGTLAAKQVLKDVGRVLGKTPGYTAKLANAIPTAPGMTIKKALDESPEFRRIFETEPEAREIIEIGKRLEGNKRHSSQHACFEAGTLIETDRGYIPIEKVDIGDMVMTHLGEYRRVTNLIRTRTTEVYELHVKDVRAVTVVTGNHPVLTAPLHSSSMERCRWKEVQELDPDCDRIVCRQNGRFVARKFWKFLRRTEPQFMYNLTVEEASSYVANAIVAHNCGLVIAPSIVSDYLPTSMEIDRETDEKSLTSQVVMSEVEELSLIKMDLLGLKTMGVIHEVIDNVQKNYGKEAALKQIGSSRDELRFQDIPLDDRKVYQMLARGETGAVFQLESPGMTKLIMQMFADIDELPDDRLGECFERLIAAVALYRPGPMDFIPNYIEGMNDVRNIHYLTPELKEILRPTYGVIVYQEQVMQIVRALAGYSMGRADTVRKAMGKKKKAIMAAEKAVFIYGNKEAFESGKDPSYAPGCLANGISEEIAEKIWGQMDSFASYA